MKNRTDIKLSPSAKRSVWRMMDHTSESDKAFAAIRKQILENSDNHCEFCGFQSDKWQEVHHLDDDHHNNKPSNLVTACPLCHQVFHLGLSGMSEGGEMIYLPEMSQSVLNQLALTCWIAIKSQELSHVDSEARTSVLQLTSVAKQILSAIDQRRIVLAQRVKNVLSEMGMEPAKIERLRMTHLVSPIMFANILMQLPDDLYERREDLLGGVRLFPLKTRFRQQIEHWTEEMQATCPVSIWERLINSEEMALVKEAGNKAVQSLRERMEA